MFLPEVLARLVGGPEFCLICTYMITKNMTFGTQKYVTTHQKPEPPSYDNIHWQFKYLDKPYCKALKR